ncbi:MAG: hypothetical protein KDB22_11395 [Planctomycetales bacterium]|nr:hypothetical protein [Planctomycetales bacterium]
MQRSTHPTTSVIRRVGFTLLLGAVAMQAELASGQSDGEQAQSITAPKLFPAKTLAYLRIDDVRELKEKLGESSLGKLANDDELKPILSEFYGSLVNSTQRMQDVIGLNLDEVLSIPTGELAVALLPSSNGNRDSDADDEAQNGRRARVPAVAMLLDAGDEITGVQVMIQRIESSMPADFQQTHKEVDRLTLHRFANPNRRNQQFAYFIDGGVMVGCSDPDQLETMANAWLSGSSDWETLAEHGKFVSIMSRCVGTEGERPQVSFYADPLALVRQLAPQNTGTMIALAALPVLGIDGIEAVGGSWIVSPPDFDSISHFHLLLSSPRRAVLNLLRPKSGSTSPEDWIPDTVASYSTINWDLASTLQGVEQLFNKFRGGEDAFQTQLLTPASERIDVDIRKDILDNLEGRITVLQGFVRPVKLNSGSNVYAFRLKNPTYFKDNVLPKLMAVVEERIEVRLESFGSLRVHVFQVGRGQRGGNQSETIRVPEICVTMIDDYVVISDSEYMMRQLSSCINGTLSKLSESIEYDLIEKRISAQLQEKECAAITFARPEESLQLFYELARDSNNRERLRQVAGENGFFKALLAALDNHKLPPFSQISQYLAPGGGFLVDEETGLHYMTFSLRR